MELRKMLVSPSKYALKCPYAMTPSYITVHNTANNASANNEISYMRTNNVSTSFHIAVDDKEAVQGLPLNRNGWHSGDGNGNGNRKSIGVEICYSLGGGSRFTKAEQNAAKVVAKLLKERKWGIDRVKKHQDWSGKYCPHRTLDMGWNRFLNMVKAHMTTPKPAPKPTPKPTPKITYSTKGFPKKVEMIRDANLWNFNFTDWSKAKKASNEVYKKGRVVDVVAVATNSLGGRYLMTDYSYNGGKIKATNGWNEKDTKAYVAPKPTPTPTPTPVPVPTEKDKFIAFLENRVKMDTEYIKTLKGEK